MAQERTVVVSGYFDPLHVGHLEYFKLARQLGDRLVVIVNHDECARRKKGFVFMPLEERMTIIGALEMVDEVYSQLEYEVGATAESLEHIHCRVEPVHVFANGGDRHNTEIPEAAICRQYGIELVDGLGAKIQSSSELVARSQRHS